MLAIRKAFPWASYQIRKIAGCACAGNAVNVFARRRFQRKPLVSDPGMHHGTCVTHVPWCMPGSLTCGDGENVPGIPGACAPAILRSWQEAHAMTWSWFIISFCFAGQSEDNCQRTHSKYVFITLPHSLKTNKKYSRLMHIHGLGRQRFVLDDNQYSSLFRSILSGPRGWTLNDWSGA